MKVELIVLVLLVCRQSHYRYMSTEISTEGRRGIINLTINNATVVDFSDIEEDQWATEEDVLNDKYYMGYNGALSQGSGLCAQEKPASADTKEVIVRADQGCYLSKVTINPIQTETAQFTPNDEGKIIKPVNEKAFLTQVTVHPVLTEEITITPHSYEQKIDRSAGKYISKVKVKPIPLQTIEISPAADIGDYFINSDPYNKEANKQKGYYDTIIVKSIRSVFTGSEEEWNKIAHYFPTEVAVKEVVEE